MRKRMDKTRETETPKKIPIGRAEDLTGRKIGKLTVLYRTENRQSPNGTIFSMWQCRCDCGNETTVSAMHLKSGSIISCGCKRKSEDLTGRVFGRLTVLHEAKPDGNDGKYEPKRWHCRCECGNEKDIMAGNLINGSTKSCGCIRYKPRKTDDLTGQRFGRLTVVGRGEDYTFPNGRKLARWECICDCGNTVSVLRQSLLAGKTHSCGCRRGNRTTKGMEGRKGRAKNTCDEERRQENINIVKAIRIRQVDLASEAGVPLYAVHNYLSAGKSIPSKDKIEKIEAVLKRYKAGSQLSEMQPNIHLTISLSAGAYNKLQERVGQTGKSFSTVITEMLEV